MGDGDSRLHALYEVSRELTTFTDLDALVRHATRRARELLRAEGCALLLLDRARQEFYFPVASQSAGGAASEATLAEIRFPADRGVAGWVLRRDQAALIENARQDPRFFDGVDERTHMVTRALLCAPLRTRSGNIGVIEVVNPAPEALTQADLEFLETLAGDIAAAYEKALLYAELRDELTGVRRMANVAGIALVAVGIALLFGAALTHLARALPLIELANRAGVWGAAISIVAGLVLLRIARGGRAPAPGLPPSAPP